MLKTKQQCKTQLVSLVVFVRMPSTETKLGHFSYLKTNLLHVPYG